ncbi:MAG: carboxypeptidase-like regulatory domain-containing protein, partial [Spirosomaceae bacterium]|nr:carboxypeptidase-like regulatory domain-containing protein [Spirosomataceae bacterium]
MKRQILFLSFILLSKFALAQDEVRINAVYNFDSYDRILDDLANKYNAPIKFGTQDFSNLSGSFIFKNNTVSECLSKLFANTAIGFKFYQDVDGYYNIVKNNVKIIDAAKYENRPIFVEPTRFNFTVQGKIIDAQSGESLPFASVSIPFSSNATTTNVDGYYTLQNIPSDTAIITVSYVGYVTQNARLSPETKLNSFIIELTNSAQNLDEVTITAERTEVIKANEVVGMIKMTPRNIAKLPNVGERDPFRAFQLMPGVSASNESSSGLYIRGGTPDQTLVLYDGFTVYHVD